MKFFSLIISAVLIVATAGSSAEESYDHPRPIQLSIIIDDVGDNLKIAKRILALPADVAVAILPNRPYSKRIAAIASEANRTIMLHLPMHTHDHRELGEFGLTLDMSEQQIKFAVKENIEAVPNLSGINNHMGSLLTRHPGHMQWVMEAIVDTEKDLFFVDSRTTPHTVALNAARDLGLSTARRHVFLDNENSKEAILVQWQKFLSLGRKKGSVIAIGHPYKNTVDVLEQVLLELNQAPEYRVVSVGAQVQKSDISTERAAELHAAAASQL